MPIRLISGGAPPTAAVTSVSADGGALRTGAIGFTSGAGVHIVDNGNGTFTFQLAGTSVTSLRAGAGGVHRAGDLALIQGAGITVTDNGDGTFTIASAGAAAPNNNESAATGLVNATSAGDAGNRADHFLGNALAAAWVQEATAPTAIFVGNSSFGIQSAAGVVHYLRAYTPNAALRVEARFQYISGGNAIAVLIRDNGTGDAAGNGVMLTYNPTGGVFQSFSFDAGVYTAHGTVAANARDWVYVRLDRDAATNTWHLYGSVDRSTWMQADTFVKAFVIAKAGFRLNATSWGAIDFFDVVL